MKQGGDYTQCIVGSTFDAKVVCQMRTESTDRVAQAHRPSVSPAPGRDDTATGNHLARTVCNLLPLPGARFETGPFPRLTHVRGWLAWLALRLGLQWTRNALRHLYVSALPRAGLSNLFRTW